MRQVLALLLFLLGTLSTTDSAHAQRGLPLTVAISCPGYVSGCDRTYFQDEVRFVRFVRDPSDAEVSVVVTAQETGGGGQRYEVAFRGQRGRVSGLRDTLHVLTPEGASRDEERQALLQPLTLGLAHAAARAGLAQGVRVSFVAPAAEASTEGGEASAPARDPWNAWVFRVQGNGFFQGQQSFSSRNLSASLSAARVTERWKVSLRPSGSSNRNTFTLSDGNEVVSGNTSVSANALVARALGPRTSGAIRARARRSTFSNIAFLAEAGPAFEYNLYPYTEATRRQLRLGYSVLGEAVAYVDTTIFNKLDEQLLRHEGSAVAVFAQPWGSVDAGLELSHYLTRPDKYRAQLFGNGSVRVMRGLNLNGFVSFAFVRDQLSLPLGGASDEEILTRQRQLATNFDYSAQVGMSYTFGSVYNSAVNARFGN